MTEMADLRAAADTSVPTLVGYTDLDWQQVPAAELEWSCRQTALHMVDALYFYAVQIVYGNPAGYLCTELALDDSASPPRLLAALSAHAELLHRIARSADPDLRAHHDYGVSDAAGFAAMGVVETLIHTFDVVRGLNPRISGDRRPSLRRRRSPGCFRTLPVATPPMCCCTAAAAPPWVSCRDRHYGVGRDGQNLIG
jgi:hypothetical protein